MTWAAMDTAPKDRPIWVWCPAHEGHPPIVAMCVWHEDAGFTVDELRAPAMWCEYDANLPPLGDAWALTYGLADGEPRTEYYPTGDDALNRQLEICRHAEYVYSSIRNPKGGLLS